MVGMAAILDIGTERFYSESLCCSDSSYQVLAQSDFTVWEEMSFEEFQDGCHGGHLGYRNETILAILNLYVTPKSDLWFGRRCRLNNFKMAAMAATLDIGTEPF